jgi:hypothetical protein
MRWRRRRQQIGAKHVPSPDFAARQSAGWQVVHRSTRHWRQQCALYAHCKLQVLLCALVLTISVSVVWQLLSDIGKWFACVVCVYAYIHTYIHKHIHTYKYKFTHKYVHTYIHTYIFTKTHTYMHIFVHKYIHHAYVLAGLSWNGLLWRFYHQWWFWWWVRAGWYALSATSGESLYVCVYVFVSISSYIYIYIYTHIMCDNHHFWSRRGTPTERGGGRIDQNRWVVD